MSNHFRAATAVQNEIDPSRAPSGTGCLEVSSVRRVAVSSPSLCKVRPRRLL